MQLQYLSLLLLASLGSSAPQAAKRGNTCGGGTSAMSSSAAAPSSAVPSATASATSAPYPSSNTSALTGDIGSVNFTSVLAQVAPKSNSCTRALANETAECATASSASIPFLKSLLQYNLTTKNQVAAIVSLVAFETGEFLYDYHHFPASQPGWCTRAMMMPDNVVLYAKSLPNLPANLATLKTATNASSVSNSTLDDMCHYLTSDPVLDFGAPSWYLTSVCSPDIQSGLKTGGQTEWAAYMKLCVGVDTSLPDEAGRIPYYTAAINALP
ncbi:hypothetical protein MMC10_001191 [Thelotrema lepadinum]|nr:hypothetical protein [Thelotrema lepadinum]